MLISKCRRESRAAFVHLKKAYHKSLFFFLFFFYVYAIDYFEITVWFTEQRVVRVISEQAFKS